MVGLLYNSDAIVAHYIYNICGLRPIAKFDTALGIVNEKGDLIGAVLFHYWNGANVEISYYGKNTITVGIIKSLANYIITTFNGLSRLTVTTAQKNKKFIQALTKLGFKYECTQHRFYGNRECRTNNAVKLVAFREQIEKVANLAKKDISNVDRLTSSRQQWAGGQSANAP